jgi:hypothetical protein
VEEQDKDGSKTVWWGISYNYTKYMFLTYWISAGQGILLYIIVAYRTSLQLPM